MRSRPLRAGHVLLGAIAFVIATAAPAGATFAGANGRIAYANFDPAIGDFALYTANPDGSHATRLSPGGGSFPDWSPNSARVAFDFWDGDAQQIATIEPDGTNIAQITTGPGIHEVPSWSPDGKLIAFDYSPLLPWDAGFFTSIYVMRKDGSHAHPLGVVSPNAFDVEPKFSPDGQYVAFSRLRLDSQGNQQQALYVMGADGSHVDRITRWDIGVEHPKWSPDSRWIMFNAGLEPNSGSNGAIYRIRPDGSRQQAIYVAQPRTGVAKPGFSPDGTKVLFVCATFGHDAVTEDLCVMDIHGFHVAKITDTPDPDQYPAWGSAPLL